MKRESRKLIAMAALAATSIATPGAGAAAWPAVADAAEVSVEDGYVTFEGRVSRRGTDVVISYSRGAFLLRERRNRVYVGPHCRRLDAYAARCVVPRREQQRVQVYGGWGRDRVVFHGSFPRTDLIDVETSSRADTIVAPTDVGPESLTLLRAGRGNDTIVGGSGNDRISDGPGDDEVHAKGGLDRFIWSEGDDVYDGGSGTDELIYRGPTREKPFLEMVDLDLGAGISRTGIDEDALSRIESVVGGKQDDHLTGDDLPNRLYGNRGDDTYDGAAGADTIDSRDSGSSRPAETVACGPGNDLVTRSDVADTLIGCELHNVLEADSTMVVEPVIGSDGVATFSLDCTPRRPADCEGTVTIGDAERDFDVARGQHEIAVQLAPDDFAQSQTPDGWAAPIRVAYFAGVTGWTATVHASTPKGMSAANGDTCEPRFSCSSYASY